MSEAAPRTLRLFFALWPDEALRLDIRRATRAAVRQAGGRPVPPENYHVTLAFLGHVPESRLAEVKAAAVPMAPVALSLDRYGYFPGPRVLWLGPAETPPALRELAQGLNDSLASAGLPCDRRPFHAHLTLCRKVRAQPRDPPQPAGLCWEAADFVLAASETAPAGARYRVLARFGAANPP